MFVWIAKSLFHLVLPQQQPCKCLCSYRRNKVAGNWLYCVPLGVGVFHQKRKFHNPILSHHMSLPSASNNYSFPLFRPSRKGLLFTISLTSAICFVVYKQWLHRQGWFRVLYSLSIACCTFGVSWLVAADISYRKKLRPPEQVLKDSTFIQVKNVKIHFQQYIPTNLSNDATWGLVLLHGFGSWLYTFDGLLRIPAEKRFDCALVAFDRPAFGFSSRPKDKKYYTQEFAVYLVDFFMDRLSQLGISNQVIVGHSMGGLTAALAALKYSHRVKALILIAAAIPTNASKKVSSVGFYSWRLPCVWCFKWISAMCKRVVRLVWRRLWVGLAYLVVQPILYFLLSLLVSKEKFWNKSLSFAWYSKLREDVVQQYRLPSIVQHWRRGCIDFVFANQRLWNNNSDELSKESQDIVQQLSQSRIPILVIHGREDRIIPWERSLQLAANIPQAQLVTIPHCGHVPQEEQPQQVWDAIRQFLYNQNITASNT